MNNELVYAYKKGQGWVATLAMDFRKDRTRPGDWRIQIWLVGVWYGEKEEFDRNTMFHQTKWVDNWPKKTWTTLEEAQAFSESYWIGDKYHAKLIKRGAKVRFINVDAGDKYDYQ